jgi:uncharacterized protein YpbB
MKKAAEQARVAEKFQDQLKQVLVSADKDLLQQRVNKAILYFAKAIVDEIILPFQEHIASLRFASKVTKYVKELRVIEGVLLNQLQKLNSLVYADLLFVQYEAPNVDAQPVTPKAKKEKPVKGASHRDTLSLYREGKSLEEIAQLRNLAISTIESHLSSFVYTGDLELEELVPPAKSKAILDVINDTGMTASSIKQRLSDAYSFGEIRAVMNYYRLQQERKTANV